MAEEKILLGDTKQLIEELIDFALKDERFNMTQFEDMAKDRYEKNREVRHTRVNDFLSKDLFGHGDNVIDKYKIANRVNDMSMKTNNIAYAAFYAGVSSVGARRMGKTIDVSLAPRYITFLEQLRETHKYLIGRPALEGINKLNHQASTLMMNVHADIEHLPLDQLPLIAQDDIVANCMSAFFDGSVYGKDDNFELTPAMKDFFNDALAEGKKFIEAAYGDNSFVPETPQQKTAFAHIKQLAEDKKKQDTLSDYQDVFENNFETRVKSMLQHPSEYAIPGKPTLKFENILLLDGMTKEDFIANKHNHSYIETEYGETIVDNLMKQFYLDDEIKDMKRQDIDPCTHIYINGKNALDLPCGEIREVVDYGEDSAYNDGTKAVKMLTYREWFEEKGGKPTLLDYAKLKCDICTEALSGSKIDVVKLSKSENGKYAAAYSPTPVEVDTKDMSKESVPLWKRILMFFGIIRDSEKEITKSNRLESHNDTVDKIEKCMRERMDFNDLNSDAAKPRTTEAVENDKQIEHTNEL